MWYNKNMEFIKKTKGFFIIGISLLVLVIIIIISVNIATTPIKAASCPFDVGCSEGQTLKFIGGEWVCADAESQVGDPIFTTRMFHLPCSDYSPGDSTTFQDVCENQLPGSRCVYADVGVWCGQEWCSAACHVQVKPTTWGHTCFDNYEGSPVGTFRVLCGFLE